MTTDEERLAEISELRDRLDEVDVERDRLRAALFGQIRALLPKDTTVRRGMLAKVTHASRYTREYVAQIRDGRVKAESPTEE